MALPLGAILQAADKAKGTLGAAAGIGFGIAQTMRAKKLERNNPMPMQTTNQNILKNVALAEQMARGGLPQRVYNNQLNQLNTGLNTGVRAASRMGGLQNINSTLRAYGQGVDNLNARDAQAQQQGQFNLMNQRNNLAAEERRVFDWNKAQPYMRMSQRVADLRSAGTQNIFGGIAMLAGQKGGGQQTEGAGETPTIENVMGTPFNSGTGLPVGYFNRNTLGNISFNNGQFTKGYD
jgi:hypothetical protein